MSSPKRMHPIAALLNILQHLKELFIPILLLLFFGNRGESEGMLYLIAVGVGLVLFLVSGFLSWYRFTYRVEENELRIEHGLLVRKKRYIPFERIQSLDVSEGILQRPFGLVKVKVETAAGSGNGEAEAVLTAIKKAEANAIHDLIVSAKRGSNPNEVEAIPDESVIYKMTMPDLLLLASTSGGVGVILSANLAIVFQFEEFIPYERVFQEMEQFISNGIMFISIVVFLGFFFVWLLAVIGTMLKYANFTLRKVEDDFIITRGLFEKRQFTIPLKRIQAIRISENIVRQPLGMATVYVESAGGSSSNEESSKVLFLPIIKRHNITQLLEPYLEDYEWNSKLSPAPPQALVRYLIRGALVSLPVIVVMVYLFQIWGLLSLGLLAVTSLWAYLQFKAAGWSLEQNMVTLRYRLIIKNTVYMRKNNVQSLSVKQSLFQKKKRLATVEAVVKSGQGGSGGKVLDLHEKDIAIIYNWYSRENSTVKME
ncbi:PH domain-containing protein [Mesobacillus maritimus]|uniref:PH domain-containing protein n=1 Tax=Mesobacillus maritimus TaxID=1643336 RepID=UPI00204068E4|nr:PH domain-containing protein [Mesobacillus maritimus]MCM3671960.1 PH domain-containing protein [Mesobacillus maritimus]